MPEPETKRSVSGRGRDPALPLAILIAACALAGCKSYSPSEYISPRVTGRVLDEETRQPIQDVRVRWVKPGQNPDLDDPPKGGQAMEARPDVRTRQDGTFVLDSERDLALFNRSSWYALTLSLEHRGYNLWTTNYTPADAIAAPNGEPLIKAGDILLRPISK